MLLVDRWIHYDLYLLNIFFESSLQGVVKPILYVGAVSNAIQIGVSALMVYVLKWGFR